MSNTIQNGPPSQPFAAPCPANNTSCGRSTYRQVASRAQEASLTIVTDQGDIVAISARSASSRSIRAVQEFGPGNHLQRFTLASLESGSSSLSVQGDLNAEELRDIGNLLTDLMKIAADFFGGQMDAAMAGAMQLGDMGSLAQLSATFRSSAVFAGQYASYHPLPAMTPGTANPFQDLARQALPERSEEPRHLDMLQAQWEQIQKFLENTALDTPAPKERPDQKTADTVEPAQRMMDRLQETMARHPRLTPFATGLGDLALQNSLVQPNTQEQTAAVLNSQNQLREDFWARLNNWLASA